MRVGIVCYPSLGGSGIVATELGLALAKQGHAVHIIAYDIPFRLQEGHENIKFHQVEINRYDLFHYPDYALPLAVKMAEVAKKEALDVFHVHYAIPHATSAYLAKKLLGKSSPKIVTTLHGTDITLVGKDPGYFDIVKFSIEESDVVTAVSENLKERTIASFGIKRPIHVIPNFVALKKELVGTRPMKCSFAHADEKLIVHASNFRTVKRVEDVVAVFQKVEETIPSKLLFLGGGPEMERAWEEVQKRGLSKKVYFLGISREIDPYLASADLFLLPSSEESFGLAALEAMAYGVPVVATRAGGIPEVVEDGVSGLLFPVGDIEAMAQGAISLLSDEGLWSRFSFEGMRIAEERFSIERVLPLYLGVYGG